MPGCLKVSLERPELVTINQISNYQTREIPDKAR
jgi:hypothetical protein